MTKTLALRDDLSEDLSPGLVSEGEVHKARPRNLLSSNKGTIAGLTCETLNESPRHVGGLSAERLGQTQGDSGRLISVLRLLWLMQAGENIK